MRTTPTSLVTGVNLRFEGKNKKRRRQQQTRPSNQHHSKDERRLKISTEEKKKERKKNLYKLNDKHSLTFLSFFLFDISSFQSLLLFLLPLLLLAPVEHASNAEETKRNCHMNLILIILDRFFFVFQTSHCQLKQPALLPICVICHVSPQTSCVNDDRYDTELVFLRFYR